MTLNSSIKRKIESFLNSKIVDYQPVGGGCISNASKIKLQNGDVYFLKTNSSTQNDMFIKEAHGILELQKANVITVPSVLLYDKEFLLTDYIASGKKRKDFSEDFGRKFAMLHKFYNDEYGFYEDNYIGSNPQPNIASDDEKINWTKFYFNKRIHFQLQLAEEFGNSTNELRNGISALENKIEEEIVTDSGEKPSILHGDLWGGNYIIDEDGYACLIDPAVYYGNREVDLAMTKLFGGFDSRFYSSYGEAYPLPEGYQYRENIYKLYHVLNHLNLFGRGYYSQAMSLIRYYL
jgi:fructosamine-3-kinase